MRLIIKIKDNAQVTNSKIHLTLKYLLKYFGALFCKGPNTFLARCYTYVYTNMRGSMGDMEDRSPPLG